jgi:PKD repeat protein
MKEINGLAWGLPIAQLTGDDTSFLVDNIEHGKVYEFRVFRNGASINASGYIYSGIDYRLPAFTLTQIIIVENSVYEQLSSSIEAYQSQLESESIESILVTVNIDDSVESVKAQILEAAGVASGNNISVFLLGNVPVPYSGNIGPDGHSNHIGAWPSDGYYADLDGNWTDLSVTNVTGGSTRTHNIPGDGKFDQSTFPSTVELAIGRADFSALPLFSDGEVKLTEKYLQKNIDFRNGNIPTQYRGLVENNFGLAEGFGQNGYKNINALLGRENTLRFDYDSLLTDSYLWSYGAGGGNYQGASGISNSTRLSTDSLQTVFTMLFGSYFGDWDVENNFLRSALASGTTLSNAWAGRPNWYFHPMGMGFNLGDCAKLTMNNSNTYDTGFGGRQVHIALMGDPSLKMYYHQSDVDFEIAVAERDATNSWSTDGVNTNDRALIYKSVNGESPSFYQSLPLDQGSFTDPCLNPGEKHEYFLSTETIIESTTGTFWNYGVFERKSIDIDNDLALTGEIIVNNQYNTTVELGLNASNATDVLWDFGDGNTSTEFNPIHIYDIIGPYTITCTLSNDCGSIITEYQIDLNASGTENLIAGNKVYPNPASDLIFIDNENGEISTIKLLGSQGAVVLQQSLTTGTNKIRVNHLPTGIFILEMVDHDGSLTHKLITLQ